jgi:aldehyde dehydrogenase (NAD+)
LEGVNNSGIGKSGGKHSFVDFSNEKGVVKKKFGNLCSNWYILRSTKIFSNILKLLLKYNEQ